MCKHDIERLGNFRQQAAVAILRAQLSGRVDFNGMEQRPSSNYLRPYATHCERCETSFDDVEFAIDAPTPLPGFSPDDPPGAYICPACFIETGGFRRRWLTVFLIVGGRWGLLRLTKLGKPLSQRERRDLAIRKLSFGRTRFRSEGT